MKDKQLTEHFSFYELTRTCNRDLQEKNRELDDIQIAKLARVAELLETCREIMGCPLDVHSGYRSPDVNAATAGSAKTSQHMKCEAADFSPLGPDSEESIAKAFDQLRAAAKEGRLRFGQLIFESAARSYGRAVWLHISLGTPYREPEKCGQVLTMKDGKYTLVEVIHAA